MWLHDEHILFEQVRHCLGAPLHRGPGANCPCCPPCRWHWIRIPARCQYILLGITANITRREGPFFITLPPSHTTSHTWPPSPPTPLTPPPPPTASLTHCLPHTPPPSHCLPHTRPFLHTTSLTDHTPSLTKCLPSTLPPSLTTSLAHPLPH